MTAEELMLQRLYVTNDGEPASIHDNFNTVKDTMVEFAKYHVQKALESASKTHLSADNDERAFDKMGEVIFSEEAKEYNENQLLTCYSLDLIK